jgi:hypothetical protein
MTIQRQAPHFNERVLQSTLLLQTLFLFSALLAFQVGLPGLLATREGADCVRGASSESLRGGACMVALPPPRLYLPAAD